MTTLPTIPEHTQVALKLLVEADSNPNGDINYPSTTAKSIKHPYTKAKQIVMST